MHGLERQIGVTTRAGAYLSPGATALLAELKSIAAGWR
jgi:LysR family transcriptional regulator of gallate degradation